MVLTFSVVRTTQVANTFPVALFGPIPPEGVLVSGHTATLTSDGLTQLQISEGLM